MIKYIYKKVDDVVMNKIGKVLIILLFTILTLMTLNINISPWVLPNSNGIIYEMFWTIKDFDIIISLMGIFVFVFYYNIYFDGTKLNRKSIFNMVLSSIFSIVIVIGKILQVDNISENFFTSFHHFFKCMIMFFGLYFIFYAFIKKILKIDISRIKQTKKAKKKPNKLLKYIDNHPVITTTILIIICRLPYIIIHYPFSSTGDTFDFLCQFFHVSNSWTIKSINLVNDNVYLNTHHPLLFTLVFGFIIKVGVIIKDYTLGAFIYTILQTILSIIIFDFVIYYAKKINIPLWIRIFLMLFISLTPTISAYTITAIKDTPSALFTLLYTIFLLQMIRNVDSILKNNLRTIFLMITILLVIMLRNNGIITILLSYSFLFWLYKKEIKKLLIVLIIPIIIGFSFNSIAYNFFDVTKGSKRELLSIPFMQITRVMKNGYKEEFSKEDKKIVDNILGYEELENNYYPNIADSVKDRYNKNATDKDLKKFFQVWFKYLCKHPTIYIKSIIASTYQYFYPNIDMGYAILGIYKNIEEDFGITGLKCMEKAKDNLDYFNRILGNIPIIGLFFRVAFYDWILLLSSIYVIYKKKYKYLIPLLPLLAVLLVCLASPLNGAMRYILPIVFSLPTCIIVCYLTFIDDKEKIKSKV